MSCELIGWCALPAEAQAAWIQAIGSIAAILSAVEIARRQARQAKRLVDEERQRQAVITATGLALAFEAVQLEAELKLGILESFAAKLPTDNRELGHVQAEELVTRLQLDVAWLAAVEQQALLFDQDTGKLLVIAARSAQNFNRFLRGALLPPRERWLADEMRSLHERLTRTLRNVIRATKGAVRILEQVHGLVAEGGDARTIDSSHGNPP